MAQDELPRYYSQTAGPLSTGNPHFQGYILEPLEIRRSKSAYLGYDYVLQGTNSERFIHRTWKPSFDDEEIRKRFVFKLFAFLSCQLLFILLVMYLFLNIDILKKFINETPILWIISGGLTLFIMLLLSFVEQLRRIRTVNLILLLFLVLFLSVYVAGITVHFDLRVVTYSFAIETAIAVFVTVLAKFALCDVAGCAMIFCVLGTVISVFIVVTCLIWLKSRWSVLQLLVGGGSLMVSTLYLMFSTQIMMDRKYVSPEEIVRGNIRLYIGIVLLFKYIIVLVMRPCIKTIKRMKW